MTVWDTYPASYRESEIKKIVQMVEAGECVCVLGLSGSGKSNLMGFLAYRVEARPRFLLIDCNRLPDASFSSLLDALIHLFDPDFNGISTLQLLIKLIDQSISTPHQQICIIFDRFDHFQHDQKIDSIILNQLRALRDRYKYDLTFVISTRRPLDSANEFSELIYGNTFWLSPLTWVDAQWSITQYARRHHLTWNEQNIRKIFELSKGFPSLLRGVCEACAHGTELSVQAMQNADQVQQRVKEFWEDKPEADALEKSNMAVHPLFVEIPITQEKMELTALEERLLQYLSSHVDQICSKEELISAVWSEEKQTAGLRDDSLTQLVHRLREKINPTKKNLIQSIPGRGYRYHER